MEGTLYSFNSQWIFIYVFTLFFIDHYTIKLGGWAIEYVLKGETIFLLLRYNEVEDITANYLSIVYNNMCIEPHLYSQSPENTSWEP